MDQEYILWVNKIPQNQKWDQLEFHSISYINTKDDFASIFHTIPNWNCENNMFYLMKTSSYPSWEHESNANGGTISIRIEQERMHELFQILSVLLYAHCLTPNDHHVNGISLQIKSNWGLIKIWTNYYNKNMQFSLPNSILKKYSISPRFKKNEPEF